MNSELINKIIFGKYKVGKNIGKGSFGSVFKGKNIVTNEMVAIKVEDGKTGSKILESEAYFLFYLKNFGIPEIKSFGTFKKYKILVQTLLGNNFQAIFVDRPNKEKKFNCEDACLAFIQLLDRLEFIHSKYVIHRDLKPENIMLDLESKKTVYLIDFGMSKKYRSGKTKKHIKFSIPSRLTGTARYCSINALRGTEQSRRDDLESAGYVMIYLAQGGYLPWIGFRNSDKLERYRLIYRMKKKITTEELCKRLPKAFCEYIKYTKKLNFEEDPNYNYMRGLFLDYLNTKKNMTDLKFSWVSKKTKKKKEDKNLSPNHKKTSFKRKISPQSRILRNIQTSQERENKMNKIKNETLIKLLEEKQEKRDNEIIQANKKEEIMELPPKQKNNYDIQKSPTFYKGDPDDKKSEDETHVAQLNMAIFMDNDSEDNNKKDSNQNELNDEKKIHLDENKEKSYNNDINNNMNNNYDINNHINSNKNIQEKNSFEENDFFIKVNTFNDLNQNINNTFNNINIVQGNQFIQISPNNKMDFEPKNNDNDYSQNIDSNKKDFSNNQINKTYNSINNNNKKKNAINIKQNNKRITESTRDIKDSFNKNTNLHKINLYKFKNNNNYQNQKPKVEKKNKLKIIPLKNISSIKANDYFFDNNLNKNDISLDDKNNYTIKTSSSYKSINSINLIKISNSKRGVINYNKVDLNKNDLNINNHKKLSFNNSAEDIRSIKLNPNRNINILKASLSEKKNLSIALNLDNDLQKKEKMRLLTNNNIIITNNKKNNNQIIKKPKLKMIKLNTNKKLINVRQSNLKNNNNFMNNPNNSFKFVNKDGKTNKMIPSYKSLIPINKSQRILRYQGLNGIRINNNIISKINQIKNRNHDFKNKLILSNFTQLNNYSKYHNLEHSNYNNIDIMNSI